MYADTGVVIEDDEVETGTITSIARMGGIAAASITTSSTA